MPAQLTITALSGVPLVKPGDDLAAIALAGYAASGLAPADGDVLVVAQKIVSKAEDRVVDVATVEPSERAIALAAEIDKDPRLVEVILSESRRIVRHRPNLLIAEHRRGWVMANAGIDHSNVAPPDGIDRVLLLPLDPDGSALGRKLEVTETGFADEIAAAASLVQGQADEGTPIVLVRGLTWSAPEAPAAALVRPAEHDLFR